MYELTEFASSLGSVTRSERAGLEDILDNDAVTITRKDFIKMLDELVEKEIHKTIPTNLSTLSKHRFLLLLSSSEPIVARNKAAQTKWTIIEFRG